MNRFKSLFFVIAKVGIWGLSLVVVLFMFVAAAIPTLGCRLVTALDSN